MQVHTMIKSDFRIEMEVECDNFKIKCWENFVYLSTDDHTRKMQ